MLKFFDFIKNNFKGIGEGVDLVKFYNIYEDKMILNMYYLI